MSSLVQTQTNTITFTTTLDPGFADPIHLIATIPTIRPIQGQRNKKAIMLIMGSRPPSRGSMGCYIYSIYNVCAIHSIIIHLFIHSFFT